VQFLGDKVLYLLFFHFVFMCTVKYQLSETGYSGQQNE